jgi:hypothetical protein
MTPAAAADEGGRPAQAKGGRPRQAKGASARRRSNPLGRLRTGEAIYLVAAILLFVLMFFDWYGVTWKNESIGGVSALVAGGSVWQTLEVLPLFLMLTIAVTVGAALLRLSGSAWKPAIPPAAAVCALGLLAALGILGRMISTPDLGGEGIAYGVDLELGIFLALAAALGIAYGGRRAMADEGTSFAGVAKRLESPQRPKPAAKKPTAGPNSATASKPAAKKPASPRRPSRKKP